MILQGFTLFRNLANGLGVAPFGGCTDDDWGTYECARLVCEKLGVGFVPVPYHTLSEDAGSWAIWLSNNSADIRRKARIVTNLEVAKRKFAEKKYLKKNYVSFDQFMASKGFGKRKERKPRAQRKPRKHRVRRQKAPRGVFRKIMAIRSPNAMSKGERDEFYDSAEWHAMRYKIIAKYGRKCMACGRTPEHGIIIHVDHIKPLWTHPELKLNETNLQILCHECNQGKGCLDDTDFRPDADAQQNS